MTVHYITCDTPGTAHVGAPDGKAKFASLVPPVQEKKSFLENALRARQLLLQGSLARCCKTLVYNIVLQITCSIFMFYAAAQRE
jgi:hypothetical protein